MSLRAIHIVFIIASSVLATLMTVWSVAMFASERGDASHLTMAAISLGGLVLMATYGVRFTRKTRRLGIR